MRLLANGRRCGDNKRTNRQARLNCREARRGRSPEATQKAAPLRRMLPSMVRRPRFVPSATVRVPEAPRVETGGSRVQIVDRMPRSNALKRMAHAAGRPFFRRRTG